MKNTKLILLSLFLLLPAATQCMEPIKEIIATQSRIMQKTKRGRDNIYRKILLEERSLQLGLRHTLDHDYAVLNPVLFSDQLIKFKTDSYRLSKDFYFDGYSNLGLVMIAIKRPEFIYEKDTCERYYNALLIKNPKQISFKEKKEYIQKLCSFGFKPTDADKEMDTFNAYEPAALSRLFLQHSLFLSEIELPQEIIDSIAIIMSEIRLLP